MTFDEYIAAFSREFETARQRLKDETQLSQIETLALRIAFLFHTGEVQRPTGPAGAAIGSLVAMLTNELLGFCGTIRSGALQATWHHVRAVTELDASVHYLFDDPSKSENRVQQFVEFVSMLPWLKRRRLEVALENGEITQETFDRKNLVNDALIAHATPEKVAS